MRNRSIVITVASICLAVGAPTSGRADLFLDPTGGTPLVFPGPDDENVTRSLGGTFNFYGTDITEVGILTNGYISGGPTTPGAFFADRGIGELADFEGLPIIAPFYDDLYLDDTLGNTITDIVSPGQYYAVTYSIAGINDFDPGTDSNFQVILFTGDTTLKGIGFLAGDIVISYGALNSSIDGATVSVGVAEGSGNFTPLPGTTDGQIGDYSLLPGGPQFLLFRPDGDGYSVSIITVPEPTSMALVGLGLVGVLAVSRRRLRTA